MLGGPLPRQAKVVTKDLKHIPGIADEGQPLRAREIDEVRQGLT
jgi:hypothetical protein